jgi:N-acetyl-D-muramate 6-phosphate phosphatase
MRNRASLPIGAVLFDLDGTLLDTAPDLMNALNHALRSEGLDAIDDDTAKPYISGGARSMLAFALFRQRPQSKINPLFQAQEADAENKALFEQLVERMLSFYAVNLYNQTRFYDGIESVLDTLHQHSIPFGVVTNKISRFTNPIINALSIHQRTNCIISGDTTPEKKPHPKPLLEACERLDMSPDECVYIGDASRDIEAGHRAGMRTLAAAYGYIDALEDVASWGADQILQHPTELLNWLGLQPAQSL